MVRSDFEDSEPGPPPYDPYVSTAKLPPLPAGATPPEPEPEPESAPSFSDHTLAIGSPIPTGALFSPPTFSKDSPLLDKSEPFVLNSTEAPASAIEGPPDSLPGFSFATTSGPLPSFEAPADDADAVVSRKVLMHTDSPLELANEGEIEQHVHEPAVIEERRDPLLETFADVAESTATVGASADPDLEENAQPEGTPSMTVQPSLDVTSAWDPQAQPPKSFEPAPEPEAQAAEEDTPPPGAWGTSSYEVGATPFALSDEEAPTSSGSPFQMPTDVEPPFSMPSAHADESVPAPPVGESPAPGGMTKAFTPGVGSATQRFTMDELEQISSPDENPTYGDGDEMPALEAAPTDWTPEVEPRTDELEEIHAAAEEATPAVDQADGAGAMEGEETIVAGAVPVNGSGAHGAVPQSVIDEVVRRAMERIDDELIREIAWEVVPDLAERMILKRLGGSS